MNVTKEVYESREDIRIDIGFIRKENKRLKEIDRTHRKLLKDHIEIRDELLDFLKRVDQENWLDGDWWEDIAPLIEKTEALKEKETEHP